jgi:hypothetical protein
MFDYTAKSREEGRAPLPMNSRRDNWWVSPLIFVAVFGLFVLYTTYRMFDNAWYSTFDDQAYPLAANLLSPFYSPLIPLQIPVTLPFLGEKIISPAIYILIFPLSFRMTCYYYRKSYFRSFFADPFACAVPEPNANARMAYTGERGFPWVANNLHRYAFYAAAIFIIILGYDTYLAFTFNSGNHYGLSVGSLVFLINWLLLTGYTFGCHSWRHLIGGKVDCYSCSALSRTRYGLWQKVSFLNARHAGFAWASMISVGLTDVYVNLVARGIIQDFRFF